MKSSRSLPSQVNSKLTEKVFGILEPVSSFTDRFANIRKWPESQDQKPVREDSFIEKDGKKTGFHSKLTLSPSNQIVYDFVYSLDEKGRRLTPSRNSKSEQLVLLLGGSEAFGVGNADDETLANRISTRMPAMDVLNLGLRGAGINDNYLQIHEANFEGLSDVKNKSAHVVYYFQYGLMRRLTCPLSCFFPSQQWILKKHNFEFQDGSLKDLGTFEQSRAFKNFLFQNLARLSFLEKLNIEIPPHYSHSDVELFLGLYSEILKDISQNLKVKSATILIAPGTPPYITQLLVQTAQAKKIQVLDLSEIGLDRDLQELAYVPFDLHPSVFLNDRLAQLIAKMIEAPGSLSEIGILK